MTDEKISPPCPVELGDTFSFTPSAFCGFIDGKATQTFGIPIAVKATVDYINPEHRYYRAACSVRGATIHECFKF